MHTRTYHTNTGAMLICTHWPHTVARSRTCRHMHTHRGCTGAYSRTCIKHTYTLNTYCHTLTYIYAHKHIQHPYCCNAYACAHTMRHAHAHVDRAYTQVPYRCKTGAHSCTCIKHTYTLDTCCHMLTCMYAHAYTQSPYRCILIYAQKHNPHAD